MQKRDSLRSTWRFIFPLLVLLGAALATQLAVAEVVIKFATLAPEGTPWMQMMHEMSHEVERKSNGDVSFRFYPGGIAGDERDVIRKMRIKQLHGGAFSGFGMGLMLPESRVLEATTVISRCIRGGPCGGGNDTAF